MERCGIKPPLAIFETNVCQAKKTPQNILIKLKFKIMYENLTIEHREKFDEVLKSRHSVRAFNSIPVEKAIVDEIIKAGLIAPFAAIPAAGKTDFRKIFVISSSSDAMKKIESIVMDRLPKFVIELEKQYGLIPYVGQINQASSVPFERILNNAPYLLIAGERKGIPSNSSESLSYCMQNMWLKATSLKIGFRLLAIISQLQLNNDIEFCQLIGIQPGEFSLEGCSIGYPADSFTPQAVNYPNLDSNVIWL
jgi:nitroreductase